MHGDRFCACCGAYLGNYMIDDYYSLIRKKYCDACRQNRKNDLTLQRVHRFRRTQRKIRKAKDEQLELLKLENEMLRRKLHIDET